MTALLSYLSIHRPSPLIVGTGVRREGISRESEKRVVGMGLVAENTPGAFDPADRRLILRPSTSPEIPHIFARLEHRLRRHLPRFRQPPIHLFKIGLHPPHAGNLNLPILGDREDCRNIG